VRDDRASPGVQSLLALSDSVLALIKGMYAPKVSPLPASVLCGMHSQLLEQMQKLSLVPLSVNPLAHGVGKCYVALDCSALAMRAGC
jgi:hypothetical protein